MNYYAGTHTCELDTLGRVVVPKAFRKVPPEILAGELMLSPGLDGGVVEVYPLPEWEAYVERITGAENLTVGDRDELVEVLFADADRTKIDKQNRLVLSHALRTELGIDGADENVTLAFVGAGTHFKVYVATDYEQERDDRRARRNELLKKYRSGPNRGGHGGEG